MQKIQNFESRSSHESSNTGNINEHDLKSHTHEINLLHSDFEKQTNAQNGKLDSSIINSDFNGLDCSASGAAISAVGSRRAEAMIGGAEVLRQALSKDTAMIELEVQKKRKNRDIYIEWKLNIVQKYRKLDGKRINSSTCSETL